MTGRVYLATSSLENAKLSHSLTGIVVVMTLTVLTLTVGNVEVMTGTVVTVTVKTMIKLQKYKKTIFLQRRFQQKKILIETINCTKKALVTRQHMPGLQ